MNPLNPDTENNQNRASYIQSLVWIIPVLLAMFVNLNVLQNGFVWDDISIHTFRDRTHLAPTPSQPVYYRPVVSLSYQLDRWLWDTRPMGFHLTGLLLHLLATILITWIGLCLFQNDLNKRMIALLAGSLFAVHPVHSEVVAWIAGRNDLLSTCFLLIAVLAHLLTRQGARAWLTFPLFAASTFLALMSKESALPFLLISPFFDLLIWQTSRPWWRRLATLSSMIIVVLSMGVAWFRTQSMGTPIGNITFHETSFLKQVQMILLSFGFYIKHLIFPYPLNAFIILPPDLQLSHFAFIALGIFGILFMVKVTLRTGSPFLPIGVWAIFLGMAAALAIPLTKVTRVTFAERYLYLPSVGFVFIAAVALIQIVSPLQRRLSPRNFRRVSLVLFSLILVPFSVVTFSRNQVWQNELALWGDTVQKSPNAALPHYRLGRAYVEAGRLGEAKQEFQLALKGVGDAQTHAVAASDLGAAYFQDRQLDLAEDAYRLALHYQDRAKPYFGLGIIYWVRYQSAGDRDNSSAQSLLFESQKHLTEALLRNPNDPQAYHALGLVDLSLNRKATARTHFQKVIQLSPGTPLAEDAAQRLSQLAGQEEDSEH